MNIPWSGFTKKRDYSPEKDRLQYKDLAEYKGRLVGRVSVAGPVTLMRTGKHDNCQGIAAFSGYHQGFGMAEWILAIALDCTQMPASSATCPGAEGRYLA